MSYSNSTTTQGQQDTSQKSTNSVLTPEQQALLKSQTNFATQTYNPALSGVIGNATSQYAGGLQGVVNNANNYGQAGSQVGNSLLNSGAQGFSTATNGLSSLFNQDYLQNQIGAATGAANLQYQQNLANQNAQFGGAGQLGSSRAALAGGQLAETQRANNAQIGANIANNVANQQLQAGQTLGQLGLSGAQQGLAGYKASVDASSLPLNYTKQYGDIIYGVPSSISNPNFSGTQGQTSSSTDSQINSINKVDTSINGQNTTDAIKSVAGGVQAFKDSGLGDVFKSGYDAVKDWWNTPSTPKQTTLNNRVQ